MSLVGVDAVEDGVGSSEPPPSRSAIPSASPAAIAGTAVVVVARTGEPTTLTTWPSGATFTLTPPWKTGILSTFWASDTWCRPAMSTASRV